MWAHWKTKSWNNRRISFVAILIATSVAFTLLFNRILPFTAVPSFKIMISGLPIKLTGYIFGPLVGAITGVISDLISFMIVPTFIHYWYSLAFLMAGFVPGFVGYIYYRRWKKGYKPNDKKYNNINFSITLLFLVAITISMTVFLFSLPESSFKESKIIKDRITFLIIALLGNLTMILAVIIFRFALKPKTFNAILPIITFSSILEVTNTPLITLGDTAVFAEGEFLSILIVHYLTSPIKIWGNLIVIFFAYKVVSPLIFNKTNNGWENSSSAEEKPSKVSEKYKKKVLKNKKQKNIYVCGPTVYSEPHIGNLKPIITFDLYIRSLRAIGENVYFIHNITDIDDKIIDKSKKTKISPKDIALKYKNQYFDLLKQVNVQSVNEFPTVTENMQNIITFVEDLIEKEKAYVSNGSVYFSIDSIGGYGSLSNLNLSKLKTPSKKNKDKKNQNDFALWKKDSKDFNFDSPWGLGRPGWHTECAAIINNKTNGNGLEMHGGGIDLIFPHHENERAQFLALTGKEISKEWKHLGQLNLNDKKMSKSEGNIFDAKQFIDQYGVDTLRTIFLSSNPMSPININDEIIKDAIAKTQRYKTAFFKSQLVKNHKKGKNREYFKDISIWNFSEFNKKLGKTIKLFNKDNHDAKLASTIFDVFKTIGYSFSEEEISPKTRQLYYDWINLRNKEKFDEADKIREKLIKKGII